MGNTHSTESVVASRGEDKEPEQQQQRSGAHNILGDHAATALSGQMPTTSFAQQIEQSAEEPYGAPNYHNMPSHDSSASNSYHLPNAPVSVGDDAFMSSSRRLGQQEAYAREEQDREANVSIPVNDSSDHASNQEQQEQTKSSNIPRAPALQLEWENIKFEVKIKEKMYKRRKKKIILHPQSAYVRPGQVMAIMGPSGSGKTSLLNILAQRVRKFEGSLRVNGQKATKKMGGLMAFVQQDDVLMPNLTVYETLKYAALLRVHNATFKEKMARVEDVIKELGLESCRQTKIGKPGVSKGVSGGERKRVAIGVELLSQPSILFLDEPTTGLDASAALHVMETLHQVAQGGRSVILTLHQPRSNIFTLFDQLILLAQGHMVYFGDAKAAPDYFEKLGYEMPENYNPADFLLDTISVSTRDSVEGGGGNIEKDQQRVQHIIDGFQPSYNPSEISLSDELKDINLKKYSGYATNWFVQFFVIFWRSVLNLYRNVPLTVARLIQTVLLAVIVGLIYLRVGYDQKDVQDRAGVLYFIMVNQSMNTLFSSLALFPEDNAVFVRERGARTYRVSSYYLAKTCSELPLATFYPILFGCIVYWMVGLNSDVGRFFIFLFFMVCVAYTAQSIGEAISASSSSQNMANAIAPLIVIILMLFGGFYLNTSNLPVYTIWIYYISMFHYGFEAIFLNEFEGATFNCSPNETCRFPDGQAVIEYYGFNISISNKWLDLAFLAAICLVCKLIALISLALKRSKGA